MSSTYENKHGTATITWLRAGRALIKATSKATGRTAAAFVSVREKNANRSAAQQIRNACAYDDQTPNQRSNENE